MRRTSLVAAIAAVAAVSPLSAQTWQGIGTPANPGVGYWNQVSDDNVGSAVCNVGAILTNTPALAAASCIQQAPVYLPLNPAPLTTRNVFLGGTGGTNPGAFQFSAGTYNFALIGRIAGDPGTSWGIITDAGVSLGSAALTGGAVTVTGPFAVWITASRDLAHFGQVYSSAMTIGGGAIGGRTTTINQQFAVFTATPGSLSTVGGMTTIGTTGGETYYVGMEDNVNCGPGFGPNQGGVCAPSQVADRDYNDIIIRIQAVPEPATVGLMGFGLLALAGVAKRRKA